MSTMPASTRLTINPAYIDSQTSITIPLHVHSIGKAGSDAKSEPYKVGIKVALSAPGSTEGGAGQLYEFDTGGKGFFADAANAPTPSQTYGTVTDTYTSGNTFHGEAAVMNISFPESAYTKPFPVLIGLVQTFSTKKAASASFPGDDHGFWGDFGASLAVSTGGTTLLSVLAQFPAPFNTGFIVDVGAYPNGPTGSGQLIVGITETLRNLFPHSAAMGTAPHYTPANAPDGPSVPAFQAQPIAGTLTVGSLPAVPKLSIVLDTGAPHTTFHAGSALTEAYAPKPNDQVLLTSGSASVLNFIEGDILGVNKVKTTKSGSGSGYVNTGLAPFFANPIMFDIQNKAIRFVS